MESAKREGVGIPERENRQGSAGKRESGVQIPGKTAAPYGSQPSSAWRVVSPGYPRTLGIPLRGRDFDERDGAESQPVTILAPALTRLLNRTTVAWDRVKPWRSPQSTERLMEMRSSLGFINLPRSRRGDCRF